MMRIPAAAALILFSLVSTSGQAQNGSTTPPTGTVTSTTRTGPSVNAVAMHKLDFLLGSWEGDGWIIMGRDGRRTFHQHETVRPAAGGVVVIIDGLGKSTDVGREGQVIHQAFALVSHDSATKTFRWRAFRATGEETVAEPVIGDSSLVWGMDVGPAGHASHVRFTIELTPDGAWHEVGDLLPPGSVGDSTGSRFFEMTLHKKQ